jgi:uncharacterized DUF497 family protein
VEFEWDPDKKLQNRRKHGISFEEASTVLQSDAECLEIFDRLHSRDEDRFITIGPSEKGIVVVAWTEREDQKVRIISARLATASEQAMYRSHMEERHG